MPDADASRREEFPGLSRGGPDDGATAGAPGPLAKSPADEGRFPEDLAGVVRGLVSSTYVMTAKFEDARAGVRVLSVQPCANTPLMVCVAVRKGHVIEPLIRDSHSFVLCELLPEDRLARRKFSDDAAGPGEGEDPFDSIGLEPGRQGAPILLKRGIAIVCDVVRHFDLEADHEIYVGLVVDIRRAPGAG